MNLFFVLWIALAVSSTSAGLVKDAKKLHDVLKDLNKKIERKHSGHFVSQQSNLQSFDHHDLGVDNFDHSIDTGHTNLHKDLHTNLHKDLHTNLHNDLHTNLHKDLHTNLHKDLHTNLHHSLHTRIHHGQHTNLHHGLHTGIHHGLHTGIHHGHHTNLHPGLHKRIHHGHHTNLHHDHHTNLHHDLRTRKRHGHHTNLHHGLHIDKHLSLQTNIHDNLHHIDIHHDDLHHTDLHHKDLNHHDVHDIHGNGKGSQHEEHHGFDEGRLHDILHSTLPQYNHDHNCKHDELLPKPSNCSQFYHCSYGNLYIYECPKGLMFSANTTRCEYPEDANCTDGIVRKKICKMGELFANPHDCSTFYECVLNGEKKLMSCPKNLQWYDKLKRCEYPSTAKCVATPGPIDGGWTDWGKWRHCTATCGHGFQVRRRNCTNPSPARGGSQCIGEEFDSRECPDIPSCAEVSDKDRVRWTAWGDCSTTCGQGTRVRNRKCISQRTHKLLGDYLNCNENEFESQECPHLPPCQDDFTDYPPK